MASRELDVVAENVEEIISREAVAEVEDPEEIAREIMARILRAETPEEVLSQAGTTSARDVLDKALNLLDVRFLRSSFDEGPGVYAILQMGDPDTGEVFPVTCGSRNVLAQAFRLNGLNALPRLVKIVEAGKDTARGYRPMWMVAADA